MIRDIFRYISLGLGLFWGLPFLLWCLAHIWGFDFPWKLTTQYTNIWWSAVWINVATLFVYLVSKKK